MKRLLAAALVFIMLLAIIAPVIADSSYDEAGKILRDLGVLQGDEDGNLMLNKNLKRQDMVVMISRLYNEESKAKSETGTNIFKDLTPSRKFYIPYITWARQKGLIQGMEKDEFGFNEEVTVQQFQTVLLRALGYSEEAANWKDVPNNPVTKKIMTGLDLNPSDKLSRGELSVMVLNALRENKKSMTLTLGEHLGLKVPETFKVDAKVTIDLNTVAFQGRVDGVDTLKLHLRPTSSSISGGAKLLDIKLDKDGNFNHEVKDLEAGNYEYRFESENGNTEFQSLKIDKVAFQFLEAKADNLREISLRFTQALDTQTASFISNYSTTAGSIKDIRFKDNNKEVILILNGTMAQQSKHKVSAHRLKSVDGQDITLKDEEFTAFDRETPRVEDVVQLGNKGLKVVFSEPIRGASQNNFKIDGKNLMGSVKLENHIAMITYYSSSYAPSEGNHRLTVTGIEDFAGYKAVDEDISFSVIKDKTPPIIMNHSATLEEVVIEFDEDIDPTSANKKNFYWKSGSLKRFPDSVKFVNNKAYLEFRNHRLSSNGATIYVEDVVDYSGNRMKLTDIEVVPVIDKTSPEVISYKVSDDGRSITVYYSKNVEGKTRSNYSIKDKNDRTVYIRDIQGSGREFTILLSTPLPVGVNTLTIDNVEDTTPIRNRMVPFSARIDMKDVEKPKIVGQTGYGNHIMIQFSKEMDMNTVTNHDNYYINLDGVISYLPYESLISPGNDGKSVTIILPENIGGRKVSVGSNLKEIEVRGLKDISGNDTDPLLIKLKFDGSSSGKAKAVDYYNDKPGKQGVLIEEDIVKIKFNIPIVEASPRDFSITGRTIEDVLVDGSNEVTLYLNYRDRTSIADGDLRINTNNYIRTSIDTGVEGGQINIVDEVAPRVIYDTRTLATNGNVIELPFTEELESEGASLYRRDLEIIRESDGAVLSTNDYTTSLDSRDNSILRITINNRKEDSRYSIRVVGEGSNNANPTYIRDKQGNLALDSGTYYGSGIINRR